jgi:hypothetical protein
MVTTGRVAYGKQLRQLRHGPGEEPYRAEGLILVRAGVSAIDTGEPMPAHIVRLNDPDCAGPNPERAF